MPEIVFIWSLGALLTFFLVNWNLYLVHKSFKKMSYVQLNRNLFKVKSYWSMERGALVAIGSGETTLGALEEAEYKKSMQAAFIFGTLLIPLSWLGFFLINLYWFSLKYFMKTSVEHNIFASRLTQSELDPSEVELVLHSLEIFISENKRESAIQGVVEKPLNESRQ